MDGPAFHKADTVWFDAGAGYSVPGEVVDVDSENDSVQVINNEGHVSTVVDLKKITPRQETNFDQEDLIQLKDDADAAYLWTLKKRYENKRIYTYIGGVLLAVNPNENLSIYDAAVANQYKNQVLGTLPAHLFALGDHAYSQLLSTGQNQSIIFRFAVPDKDASISLVDFYGFEKYNNNGYEQLCINLANERLHAYFYQTVFKSEQAEYLREHIEWDSQIGSHLDNRRVVDLLTKRPSGILPLLDDECKFPKGSDESFLQKCHLNHLDKSIYGKPRNREKPEFAVKHYAGMTWYTVTGFLDKNRQVILPKAVELFTESQNTTVSQIFAGFMRDQLKAKQNTPITKYVASNFNEALTQLMEKLTMSNPQFVRCIRPNLEKVPHKFDLQLVGQQLRALGVTDTVRMRKRGYPVRFTFAKFVGRYRSILPTSVKGKEEKESVKDILLQQGHRYAQDSQIGETTVFMKEGMAEHLERSREAIATRAAVVIQKYARGSVLRRKYSRKRLAATTLQAGVRGWIARKRCAAKKVELYRDVGEQAKQSKRLQMYEELRKNHEDAEAVNNNQARDHVVTAVEYLDMPDDLVSLMKTAGDHQEKPMTKVYGDFIEHNPHMALPKDLNTMSIEEFAKQHIKGHIFEMRREPIATPFLPKSSDADFHDSLRIFKLILRYMNDSTLKEGQDALLADYIVQMALSQPAQRDEVFVQLCNQTYKNQKEKNAERGWCLMALCAAAFAPSDMLFKPLLSYVQSHADVWKDTLTNCLLRRYCAETNTDRAFPPCSLEQMALRQKLRPVVEAQFADGTVFSAELDSWSTAEEVAERCLRARGIGEPEGWTVGVDAAELCVHTAGTDYLLDILSRLELPANFPASEIPFVISNGRRGDPLHHYHQFQADDEKARKSPSDQSSVPSEPKPERKGASPPRHAGHSPESEPMSAMSGSTLNRRYLQQRSADDQRTHANGPPADPKRGPSVPMQSPPAREHRAPTFGGVQQPVMMMMPMDGRMFGMNPASWQMDNQQNYQQSFVFQHNGQQQAVNGSQGSQQQRSTQQQQHYAPPMSPTPTVFQPVIIPSFIPNMMPMMACMSPTPSSVTCVSPLTVRYNDLVVEFHVCVCACA
uniref:Uncharacterized protein n=1 Tax=Plectus sambesii TaxID=2011161 RepID=A0A914XNE1_9BILA